MTQRPRKLVIPVGGMGLRMQPATRAIPKEFLTVVDRPLIDYACEEAAEAGMEEVILVTGQNQDVLSRFLAEHNPYRLKFTFVPQGTPKGLGHAVLQAKSAVAGEPFAVLLPDMLIDAAPGCLSQLLDLGAANVVAVERVPWDLVGNYGIVLESSRNGRSGTVSALVEKPRAGEVNSNLAISGRYIFDNALFACVEAQAADQQGEVQLTSAMAALLVCQPMVSWEHGGVTFDCGSRTGLVLAGLHYGLKRPDLHDTLKAAIIARARDLGSET